MAKIPGTHKHATIASIPHSKEYKEGHDKTFDATRAARNSTDCQAVMAWEGTLHVCALAKYHAGQHKWRKV